MRDDFVNCFRLRHVLTVSIQAIGNDMASLAGPSRSKKPSHLICRPKFLRNKFRILRLKVKIVIKAVEYVPATLRAGEKTQITLLLILHDECLDESRFLLIKFHKLTDLIWKPAPLVPVYC